MVEGTPPTVGWAIREIDARGSPYQKEDANSLRVLITVEPLMYREALARSLHQHRPDFEVRIAPPGATEELEAFRPHLLVRNDTDELGPEALASVPSWVEVKYSDSMDAKIVFSDREEEAKDASTEDLLRAADEARQLFSTENATP